MLTARNSTPDKVNGLDQGANDYITKPFEIEELLARIRACMRTRSEETEIDNTAQRQLDDLILNKKTREVIRDGNQIELTAKEFDLLIYLWRIRIMYLSGSKLSSMFGAMIFLGIRILSMSISVIYERKWITIILPN